MSIPPKYEDVAAERDSLREEVNRLKAQSLQRLTGLASCGVKREDLQQRLTVAEQGLKTIIKRCQAGWSVEAIELEAEEVLEDIVLDGQS